LLPPAPTPAYVVHDVEDVDPRVEGLRLTHRVRETSVFDASLPSVGNRISSYREWKSLSGRAAADYQPKSSGATSADACARSSVGPQ